MVDETGLDKTKVDESTVDEIAVDKLGPHPLDQSVQLPSALVKCVVGLKWPALSLMVSHFLWERKKTLDCYHGDECFKQKRHWLAS